MSYETEMFENIKTMKDKVGFILRRYPETRNSDKELVQRLSSYFHLDPLEVFETCRRSRQWYQEEKKDVNGNVIKESMYLPTLEQVAKQRGINMEVWKAAFGYKNILF